MSNSDEKLNKSGWFPTPPWRFTMRFYFDGAGPGRRRSRCSGAGRSTLTATLTAYGSLPICEFVPEMPSVLSQKNI